MKIDSVIAKIQAGWLMVVTKVKDETTAVLVSPFTVPDSTDKTFHKPVLEGGGPENARRVPLSIVVPPQHLEALENLMAPVGETDEQKWPDGSVARIQKFGSPAVAEKFRAAPKHPVVVPVPVPVTVLDPPPAHDPVILQL